VCGQEAGDIVLTLSVKSCSVGIAYNYRGKKHIFQLVMDRRSSYLFEADSNDVMLNWIQAIKQCSPDVKEV